LPAIFHYAIAISPRRSILSPFRHYFVRSAIARCHDLRHYVAADAAG
jgi:hypothetical protein